MSQRVFPQLRMTNWKRTRAFYVDGLGFNVDWEHQFEPGVPVFAQLTRDGLSLGETVTAWPLLHVGLDLSGGHRFCDRSGSSPFVIDPFLPAPAGRRAALSVLTLRLVGRARSGGTNVRLGAGPALVHIAGSAYDGGSPEIRLAKQTSSGGTIAVDVTRTLGRIRLRFGVEDAIYRAAMERLPPGDTTRTPVQHDVALNVGIALPLR